MSPWQTFLRLLGFSRPTQGAITPVTTATPVDDGATAEVVELMIPSAPEPNPEDDFILDVGSVTDYAIRTIMEGGEQTWVAPKDAYKLVAEELTRRRMNMLVISPEQFNHEWEEGIEQIVIYQYAGGQSTRVPGCYVSSFTWLVEAVVCTGQADKAPGSSKILEGPTRHYYVHVGYSSIRAVTLIRD